MQRPNVFVATLAMAGLLAGCSQSSDNGADSLATTADHTAAQPDHQTTDLLELPGLTDSQDAVGLTDLALDHAVQEDVADGELLETTTGGPDVPPDGSLLTDSQDWADGDNSQDAQDSFAEVPIDEIAADVQLPQGVFAMPTMSTWVVRKAKFGQTALANCSTVTDQGETVPNPGVYTLSFTATDVVTEGEGYLFPTPGTYQVICTDSANGLTGSAEFVVAHDMLSPSLTLVSTSLQSQEWLLGKALEAISADDQEALADHLAGLTESRLRAGRALAVAAQTPPTGWPSQETIDLLVVDKPGDAAFTQAVVTIRASIQQLTKDIDALVQSPTLDNLATVQETVVYIANKAAQLDGFDASDKARYAMRTEWDLVIVEIQKGQNAYIEKLEAMLADYDQWAPDPCPGCFTLGELVVSMAIQYTLSTMPSYNKLLIEAGKSAASMAIMLMISDAIDATVSGPDAPTIQYNLPGYGNAINDGSALTLLVDGFDPEPTNSVVLFISPKIGDSVVSVVDAALATMSAVKGMGSWDNVFELGGAIVDAYNALTGDLALLEEDIPGLTSQGVVPMPVLSTEPFMGPDAGYWESMINLPPLPECVDGWMPAIGLLVPISFTRGNGPSYELVILP